ncbi:hypothetical protein, partial [Rhodovulum sulfidophilum]
MDNVSLGPHRPAAADGARATGPESRKLSQLLSDHHDLAALDSHVAASPDIPDGPELRAALRARIAARQAEQ